MSTSLTHSRIVLMSLLILIGACVSSSSCAEDWLNLGFAYDRFETTLAPGERLEAAGPLYYRDQGESLKVWAIPPVLSYSHDPGPEMTEFNFVYPVVSYIRYGQQYRFQFFQLFSLAGGASQAEEKRDRFTLFPIYFQQRSSDPSQNYTAYGPFYGDLKNRLMRDEIHYVMFPLYSQTRKRDVVTDNYVYPVFHLRHGDGLKGWQFWPLYGQEHKDVTTVTNTAGDPERSPGHDRRFVLWPFFANQYSGLGTENPEWQQAALPLYTFTRSPNRDATTVLWPFFTHIQEREKGYEEWQVPWPFLMFASGEGKTIKRFWPIYSHAQSTNQQSDAYLWPAYHYSRLHTTSLDRERKRLFYFLYSDTTEKNLETGKSKRRVNLWPLFTHLRDFNGNERTQVLALLEPFLVANHNIELEYSHAWSIWRWEKNPQTQAASQSLLWNLYRRDVRPESRRVSFFFGLYQSRKDASGSETRLAFIPFRKGPPKPLAGFDDVPNP